MNEREADQFREYIEGQIDELKRAIRTYPDMGYNDRSSAYSSIRRQFDQIGADLRDWESSIVTLPPELRRRMAEYTKKVRGDLDNLQYGFNDQVAEINRAQLLGDAYTETIEKERMADIAIEGANEAKQLGMGILEEMDRQKATINSISDNVNQLDTDLSVGDGFLNEMECRSRQRTWFLYGVVLFLIITLLVFIYYILK
jgi:hypothetical protein